MKVATAQYPINFHQDLKSWEIYFEKWILEAVEQNAQVLLFPEYGSMELVSVFPEEIRTDLELQVKTLHTLDLHVERFLSELAIHHHIIIIAPSFPYLLDDKIINRTKVYGPQGYVGFQDKLFMTRFENEDWRVSRGEEILTVFESEWGNFGIQVCYDIEFPIGTKLLTEAGADIILVPSCCETLKGATRVHIGARARALEYQVYTVVAQTIGDCDWSPAVDINYGYTAVYSTPDAGFPDDGIIATMPHQTEGWLFQELDLKKLSFVRNYGNVFNYKDSKTMDIQMKNSPFKVQRIKI